MLDKQMQVRRDKIKYLLIPKPTSCLAMTLQGAGFEDQEMAAIFEGGHVGVERLPSVAHQDHSAGRGELTRDATPLQGRGIAQPGQRFRPLCLRKRFKQADTASVGIQAIDVIEDKRLVPVLAGLEVNAKRGGLSGAPLRPVHQT